MKQLCVVGAGDVRTGPDALRLLRGLSLAGPRGHATRRGGPPRPLALERQDPQLRVRRSTRTEALRAPTRLSTSACIAAVRSETSPTTSRGTSSGPSLRNLMAPTCNRTLSGFRNVSRSTTTLEHSKNIRPTKPYRQDRRRKRSPGRSSNVLRATRKKSYARYFRRRKKNARSARASTGPGPTQRLNAGCV